jgi:threonine dehydrogenase-like Zn-dependent dehydrogenase
MRAAVIERPGVAALADVATPSPGAGQVLVAIEGCGVCGSDLPVWEGRDWFDYPREPGSPGHEGWGRVAAVGAGVRGLSEGERVAAISYRADADYDLAEASRVVPLPPELDGHPFPGEPLGCAMNVMRRSGVRDGETVAVVGTGFLGALICRLAASAGARVIAVSRRAFALSAARQMGAHETVPLDDEALARVEELTGGALCDRVFEVTGKAAPLDLAGRLTRVRGTLVIAGFHQDGRREVDMQLWNWRGIDVINAHERDPEVYVAGVRAAVAAVAGGTLDPTPLYTHEFALPDLGRALTTASDRPDGFLKALVRT